MNVILFLFVIRDINIFNTHNLNTLKYLSVNRVIIVFICPCALRMLKNAFSDCHKCKTLIHNQLQNCYNFNITTVAFLTFELTIDTCVIII